MIAAASNTSAAFSAAPAQTQAQVMKSARDFEAVFSTEMLSPMFEGIEVDPTFGGGHGEEMFRTMLLDQYGKQMAANDSLGMVHQIADTLLKIQEGKH
jgi:Rod binding domain-containing protein